MAWLYVPTDVLRSVAASAGSSLASTMPLAVACARSCTRRGKHMPWQSWRRALKTDGFATHLYGMTLRPSLLQLSVDAWISSLRDTPASLSPRPGAVGVPMTQGISGLTSADTSASCVLASSSVKTCPAILPWGLNKSAKTYRQWAIQLSQAYSRRQKSARRINGNDCLSLPTPTASQYGSNCGGSQNYNRKTHKVRPSLAQMAAKNLWPTPTTPSGGAAVPADAKWVGMTSAYKMDGSKIHVTLQKAVHMLPTITACQALKGSLRYGDGTPTLVGKYGNRLSPLFVEEMMGLEIGWTACVVSAMPSSQPQRASLSVP